MKRVGIGVFAGVIALAGVIVAPGAAHAASAACGSGCAALASKTYGTSDVSGVKLILTRSGVITDGAPVLLYQAGEDYNEDFNVLAEGTVSEFYDYGIIGPAVGLTWPTDEVYEYEYSPAGIPSGYCLGTASTAGTGTGVTLQPCGVSAVTCWVALAADENDGYEPLIAASETSATNPEVLAEPGVGDQLVTTPLTFIPREGIYSSQLWENVYGVL